MTGYLAKVLGENFEFEFDDDVHSMSFVRTVHVNASDELKAELSALGMVQTWLREHALWNENGEQLVTVEVLEPCNEQSTLTVDQDFFWYFSDQSVASSGSRGQG